MGGAADGSGGPPVTFGSASLLDADDAVGPARAVLEAALDAGAARLDVAPMYGYGATEPLVLALARVRGVPATTKVGIEPRARPPLWRRAAAATLQRMPASTQTLVRRAAGAGTADPLALSGRFGLEDVRASIDRSLRRAARLDRLLLHEVQPPDVTDELLQMLEGYRARGDVGELGCATRNAITVPVLERGAGVLVVAHVSVAPLGDPVPVVPPGTRLVGHGAFGPGGRDLRRLGDVLRSGELADRWTAATTGTPFGADDGLVSALLARGRALGVDELLVATTRSDRARALVEAAASAAVLGPEAARTLQLAVARSRPDTPGGTRRAD